MANPKYWFPWHCPYCHISGSVYFDDNIDVWLVIQKVTENHKKLSPACEIWWSYIKTGEENVPDPK
jgi:hypothetical protein